jgi:tetratricopeptide (TPR) repeat protein
LSAKVGENGFLIFHRHVSCNFQQLKNLIVLFAFVFLAVFNSSAELKFTTGLNTAYENIIRLRLDEGKRLLDKEIKENPDNNLALLYYNYIDFFKAFITEEKTYADSLWLNAERRLRTLEHEDEKSPLLLFSKASITLQDAFIKIKFREYVSSALDTRKAYKLTEENIEKFPNFPLNKMLIGLLHSIMGNVPKEYYWVVSLAGMEGTVQQGVDEMNSALNSLGNTEYSNYKEEVLFYLAQTQSSLSLDGLREQTLMKSLRNYTDESLLLTYCYVNLAMKAGKNEEAITALNKPEIYKDAFPFAYINYKKGLLHLRKLDWRSSEDFNRFIHHFNGINFIKAAYQKLGWIALMNGDKKKYNLYMDSCLLLGKDIVDEDKDAVSEANDPLPPDTILLRARLLFDGGYYSQSLQEIAKMKLTSATPLKFRLECIYRYARLFQKMGHFDDAIQYYERAYDSGKDTKYYYAANSALLLGNIYEGKKDFEKARKYYETCLSMRHHDYQNSIDQKAQVGLERLKTAK